jgi:hypothetical protein
MTKMIRFVTDVIMIYLKIIFCLVYLKGKFHIPTLLGFDSLFNQGILKWRIRSHVSMKINQ